MTGAVIPYTQYRFVPPVLAPAQEAEVARRFAAMGRDAVLAELPFIGERSKPAFRGALTAKPTAYLIGLAVVAAICVVLWLVHAYMLIVLALGGTVALAFTAATAHAATGVYRTWVDGMIAKGQTLPPI